MSKLSVIRLIALYGVALGVGATVATSCIGVNYPTVAFRCNPRQSDNCPDSHFCCSDDPAAEDGALPNYTNKNISGGQTPYFSGINNGLGTSGMCVNRDDIPTGSGLLEPSAANCPIPCNPTWTREEIDVVCGASRVCCQTTELEQSDCVRGENDDAFRPVTGADIGSLTDWNAGAHMTHQDPAGIACTGFANNDQTSPVFLDCIAQLTVAGDGAECVVVLAADAIRLLELGGL
ncbi:MAG: hypothetical protein AAF721_11255, partial [Myxococcota bacterium]